MLRFSSRFFLRAKVAGILRTPFLEVDTWKQASLLIWFGGLGIIQIVPLAGPVFIGSCALMHGLVAAILHHDLDRYVPPHAAGITFAHGLLTGSLIHYDDSRNVRKVQKRLMDERHELESELLLVVGSLCHRARLRGLSLPHANNWLYALLISALDQRVHSRPFRIMLRCHLGAPILGQPSKSLLCAHLFNSFGDHIEIFLVGGDKTRCHDAVSGILFLAAHGTVLSVEGARTPLAWWVKKPADLLIQNFSEGFHVSTFNLSIIDMLQFP